MRSFLLSLLGSIPTTTFLGEQTHAPAPFSVSAYEKVTLAVVTF
jgi:hypothetical protein